MNNLRDGVGAGRIGMNADRLGGDACLLAADRLYAPLLNRPLCSVRRDRGLDRVMLARDHETSVVSVVKIDIELNDDAIIARLVGALMFGINSCQ